MGMYAITPRQVLSESEPPFVVATVAGTDRFAFSDVERVSKSGGRIAGVAQFAEGALVSVLVSIMFGPRAISKPAEADIRTRRHLSAGLLRAGSGRRSESTSHSIAER